MNKKFLKSILIFSCLASAYGVAFFLSWREDPAHESLVEKVAHLTESKSPPADEVVVEEGPYDETLTLSQGDTLAALLGRIGIPSRQAHEVIQELSKVFNPKDLKADQEIYVVYDNAQEGKSYDLTFLRFQTGIDQVIELVHTNAGAFQATKYTKELKREYKAVKGAINISLYADALKAGASPKMLSDMIRGFSYDVDFQRDIHPGVEFALFYDVYKDEESGLERPGELLFAELTIGEKNQRIYRFQPPGGVPDYYTSAGEAVRKALLRTPIDGARLSSGYGKRKHPVQGFTKMHKGVDFSAPKGTPIMAAGDGVVERCNRYGAYGNYVCIRHNGTTKTAYAHLSKFGKVKKGQHIKQGHVIGYVGATGNATGPHLHFELLQNGKHVNPQKVTQMPKTKLGGKALKEFRSFMAKVERLVKESEAKTLALNP